MKNFKWGKSSLHNLKDVEDITRKWVDKALEISNVDFGITSGKRDEIEQYRLFLDGLTDCDGYEIKSVHQYGYAIDVLVYIKDKDGFPINGYNLDRDDVKLAYMEVGRALLRAGRLLGLCIEWGITYDFKHGHDIFHFQINIKKD